MTAERTERVDRVERLVGLPPRVTIGCRVLILGSFPGRASLDARQYYAHPQNRFWPLMAAVFSFDISKTTSYAAKVRALNARGVGLWDIYHSCERQGSLDQAIRNPQFNDFAKLLKRHPTITSVCLNGATAAKARRMLEAQGVQVFSLPSTSPANASQSWDYKLAQWSQALAQ